MQWVREQSARAIFFAIVGFPLSAVAEDNVYTGTLVVETEIPRRGDFLGFGFDSVWMMSGSKLARVNPSDNSVLDIDLDGAKGSYRRIAIGEDAVWVADTGSETIYKIDPVTNTVALTIPVVMGASEGSIGVGAGSVWVIPVGTSNLLTRFSAADGVKEAEIKLPGGGAAGVVVDYDSVWVTSSISHALYRINVETNTLISTIPTGKWPLFLTSGEGSIWVLNQWDGSIQRIDGKTGTLIANIDAKLTGGGGDIAAGGGFIWVTATGVPVAKIDPKSNTVIGRYRDIGHPTMGDALVYGDGALWISGGKIHRIALPP